MVNKTLFSFSQDKRITPNTDNVNIMDAFFVFILINFIIYILHDFAMLIYTYYSF